jgi:hypothetical protein
MDDKLADRRKHPRILQLIFTKQKKDGTHCRPFFLLSILPYDKYCAVVLIDGNRKHSVCRRFRLVP